jgi:hypothetical protein
VRLDHASANASHNLLGGSLAIDESREGMKTAARIASILLLEPSLDANYQAIQKRNLFLVPSEKRNA